MKFDLYFNAENRATKLTVLLPDLSLYVILTPFYSNYTFSPNKGLQAVMLYPEETTLQLTPWQRTVEMIDKDSPDQSTADVSYFADYFDGITLKDNCLFKRRHHFVSKQTVPVKAMYFTKDEDAVITMAQTRTLFGKAIKDLNISAPAQIKFLIGGIAYNIEQDSLNINLNDGNQKLNLRLTPTILQGDFINGKNAATFELIHNQLTTSENNRHWTQPINQQFSSNKLPNFLLQP